jgi:hypothetical protein
MGKQDVERVYCSLKVDAAELEVDILPNCRWAKNQKINTNKIK